MSVPLAFFPDGSDLSVGNMVQGRNEQGQQLRATILSVEEEKVFLDHNHPLAGKDLNFQVELVEVEKS